jgi:hypothetical protein
LPERFRPFRLIVEGVHSCLSFSTTLRPEVGQRLSNPLAFQFVLLINRSPGAPIPLPLKLTSVGTSRCDVRARESAGGIVAPLKAARTAQRAVPTRFRGSMREDLLRRNLSMNLRPSPHPSPPVGERVPDLSAVALTKAEG